jgi:DNA-binding CsgD family transcriptional regulator
MTSDSFTLAARLLGDAPWSEDLWPEALQATARACGFWCGSLIGADADFQLAFVVDGGHPPELIDAWLAIGGPEAQNNPRADAVRRAPFMSAIEEADYIDDAERSRHVLYREVYDPFDVGYSTVFKAPTLDGGSAIFTGMRSYRRGHLQNDEKRRIAHLSPVLAEAVRVHNLIASQREAFALATFEAADDSIIFCDQQGRVRGVSAKADQLLAANSTLVVRQGRLAANPGTEDTRLQQALSEALYQRGAPIPYHRTLLLLSPSSALRLEIVRLPSNGFGRASIAVLVRQSNVKTITPLISYGLTKAEAEIVLALANGASPGEISERREVSIQTVRSQIKHAYAKLDVTRISQLFVLLKGFER